MKYQQSEPIAERRRWIIVLVSDADATAPLTGATGQVYLSKNGAAGVLSTNSLVEVDAANMPGHYYVQLTQGELDTLGWISLYAKTASSKAFEDRAFVSYDDPAARHGGFAQETGKNGGLSKAQARALLADIRTVVQEELAKDEVEDDQEEAVEQKDYTAKLDAILAAVNQDAAEVDLAPVLEAITNMAKPADYSKQLAGLATQIMDLAKDKKMNMAEFETSVQALLGQVGATATTLDGSVANLTGLTQAMADIQGLMEQFKLTLADQSDMDKRFDAMSQAANNKVLASLTKKITILATEIIDLKFELKKKQ